MPVSDDAHREVLNRLDAQDRMLQSISAQGRETNGRISRLELKQAIMEDRAEQAVKTQDLVNGRAHLRLTLRQTILMALGAAASYGGILAAIIAQH